MSFLASFAFEHADVLSKEEVRSFKREVELAKLARMPEAEVKG